MARAAAVIAIFIMVMMFAAPSRGVVNAQTPPPPAPSAPAPASAPVTAADVTALRQSLEQLEAQLAALNRRITVIEQEINAIESR
jgi:hypothetical protein